VKGYSIDTFYVNPEISQVNRDIDVIIFQQTFQSWHLEYTIWEKSTFVIKDNGKYSLTIDKILWESLYIDRPRKNWIYGITAKFYSNKNCQNPIMYQSEYVFDILKAVDEDKDKELKEKSLEITGQTDADTQFSENHLRIQCASFTRWIR
jgi:hypothetical protein